LRVREREIERNREREKERERNLEKKRKKTRERERERYLVYVCERKGRIKSERMLVIDHKQYGASYKVTDNDGIGWAEIYIYVNVHINTYTRTYL